MQANKPPVGPSSVADVLEYMQNNRGHYFSLAQISTKFGLGKNAARARLERLAGYGDVLRSKYRSLVYYFVPAPKGTMALSRSQDFKPLKKSYTNAMAVVYAIIEERRLK